MNQPGARKSSVFGIFHSNSASQSLEDLPSTRPRSQTALRPLPASRDVTPMSHQRIPSTDFQTNRASSNLSQSSRDQSPRGRQQDVDHRTPGTSNYALHAGTAVSPMFPQASRDQSPRGRQHQVTVRTSGTSTLNLHPGMAASPMPLQDERNDGLLSIRSNFPLSPPLPLTPRGDRQMTSRPGSQELPLPPPPSFNDLYSDQSSSGGSRPASKTRGQRRERSRSRSGLNSPGSGTMSPQDGSHPTSQGAKSRGRAFLQKVHKASGSVGGDTNDLTAWAVTSKGREPYDLFPLTSGQRVPELWNEHGNLTVRVLDSEAGAAPSFKVDASTIASSKLLTSYAYGTPYHATPVTPQTADPRIGRQSHDSGRSVNRNSGHNFGPQSQLNSQYSRLGSSSVLNMHGPLVESPELTTTSPRSFQDELDPQETTLYIPLGVSAHQSALSTDDLKALISLRNLFAFLTGQVMVGTAKQATPFAIFNNIAGLLKYYEFTNLDGTSLGEIPIFSFSNYVEDLHLNDVRSSREKTIEAIVLGERMQSSLLYNEGYVHGVGKYEDLVQLESTTFGWISQVTRKRLEKSSLELSIRLLAMRRRLEDLEFPGLFAGIASSKSAAKGVDPKAIKEGFASMRKHVVADYKRRYGAWPPKAKSKKNDFEESGLNRLLLQDVYHDFSMLYDHIVDRKAPTTRASQITSHDEQLSDDPRLHFLRRLLSEFDHSSPPVQPPIPFDIPMLPRLESTRRDFAMLPEKSQAKERGKRLKDDEINLSLMQASNHELSKRNPFVQSFTQFEREAAHGKSVDEIAYLRLGQWLFLYVVLQSLPLVIIDAPGLQHTQGVEYFLCTAPKGPPPWAKDDTAQQAALYRVSGSSSFVALPSDHSVDSIYQRSHCWQVAAQWSAPIEPPASSRAIYRKPLTNTTPRSRSAGREPLHLPNSNLRIDHLSAGPATSGLAPSSTEPHTLPRRRPISFQELDSGPRRVLAVGLEPLALPPAFAVMGGAAAGVRRVSMPDPTASFESILGAVAAPPAVTKMKKRWDSLGGTLGGTWG